MSDADRQSARTLAAGTFAVPGVSRDVLDFGPLAGLAGFMLRLAQVRVFESFFRDFGAREITPGQVGILVSVGLNPGVRQGVLAEALRIKRSNMAKIVRLLEERGLDRAHRTGRTTAAPSNWS